MLSFALAGAIPIVLHLLNRRRQQQIPWAAMQLLQQVIERETKRIRIEQLLLLLIRTSILILLAFILARPFLTDFSSSASSSRAPKLWVIAIDTSYSMKYREEDGTRLQIAKIKANELIESAVEGDAFALIELNEPTRTVIQRPTFDRERMLAEIRRLRANDMGSEIGEGIEVARRIVEDSRQSDAFPANARTIFLSDLGKEAWEELSQQAQPIRELGQSSSFEALSVCDSTLENSTFNLAISDIQCESYDTILGQPSSIQVQVHNYSAQDLADVPIQLAVDGQMVDLRKLNLAAGAEENISFTWTSKTTGFVVLTVSLNSDDGLAADDQRSCVVEVRERYRVLCVDDQPNSSRLIRLGLEAAFGPDAISLDTCSLHSLGQQDFTQWDAVVLNNPSSLSRVAQSQLKRFASDGGGVLLGLGPAATTGAWPSEKLSELLGYELAQVSAEELWSLDPLEYRSPVVSVFAGFPDTGLLTTPVFQYWKIDQQSPALQIDLAFTNGDPLIVRHRVGDGWVATILSAPENLATESSETSWNSIATWPSFVPLMGRLLVNLLDTTSLQFTLPCGDLMSGRSNAPSPSSVEIRAPKGEVTTIVAEQTSDSTQSRWFYSKTQDAGIYTASYADGSTEFFALNLDAEQSSLASLPAQQILRIEPKEPVDENLRSVSDASLGSQLARKLLFGLLALLIAESIIAWFIGKRVG